MATKLADITFRPNGTFIYRNSFRERKRADSYAYRLRKKGYKTSILKTTKTILPGATIPIDGVLYSVYIKSE